MNIILKNSLCSELARYAKALIPTTGFQKGAVVAGVAASALSGVAMFALGSCYVAYKWALPDYAHVYHPKIPKPTSNDFSQFTHEINRAREHCGEIVGLSYVQKKDSKHWIPVAIAKQVEQNGIVAHFFVLDLQNGVQLGTATTHLFGHYSNQNGAWVYGNELYESFPKNILKFSAEDLEPVDKVFLHHLKNEDRDAHKYVGYLVIKAIQQTFKERCQGRLFTSAAFVSHGFYYKLGARTYEAEKNQQILNSLQETALCGTRPRTGRLWTTRMYLPEGASAEWLAEIEKNPLLPPEKLL